MKTTDHFKDTIKAYLDKRAQEDELFAASYTKEGKSLDDCCTYILNAVHKSGCNGFTDDEIFGMAVHYYDEDNIDVGKPIECSVVVNHTIELTEQDIEEARKQAIEKVTLDHIQMLMSKPKAQKTEVKSLYEQPSLF